MLAAVTFGAAYIRGLTGFGMAIILVPLFGLIVKPGEAVVIAILLQTLIGPVGLKVILADAHRQSALLIAGFAVLATPLGILLLMHTTPDVARLMIAAIAIGAFLLVLLPQRGELRPGPRETALTGIAAGVLTGFAAMPGPPVVPFYLRQPIPPKEARASMMLVFFATAIAGTISAFALGLADGRLLWLSLLLFPSVLLGNWLGARSFGKVAAKVWRSFVAGILGLAGLSAVIRLLN
ncbi:TSUP family transporter [Sphingorhabdus sp.]|uniref:TSUP family transporter n=1 Tax=Sphingorhabdus sp. TaxID=1902408 RepID=UPI00391BDAF0